MEQLQSLGLYPWFRPPNRGFHRTAIPPRRAGHHSPTHYDSANRRCGHLLQRLPLHGPLHAHILPPLLFPSCQGHDGRRFRHPHHSVPCKHHPRFHCDWREYHNLRLVHALHVGRSRDFHRWGRVAVYIESRLRCGDVDRISDPHRYWRWGECADTVYISAGGVGCKGYAYWKYVSSVCSLYFSFPYSNHTPRRNSSPSLPHPHPLKSLPNRRLNNLLQLSRRRSRHLYCAEYLLQHARQQTRRGRPCCQSRRHHLRRRHPRAGSHAAGFATRCPGGVQYRCYKHIYLSYCSGWGCVCV